MNRILIAVAAVALVVGVVIFINCFDTLEYQELGLNFSWISQSVEDKAYTSGRYYLGLGNHFIKYPRMVTSMSFIDSMDDPNFRGPALQSRTLDGLNVRLEVSFQYRINSLNLYGLYTTLGTSYEQTFVRMAIEQLTTSATKYNASFFFTNRTQISEEMKETLSNHFNLHGFAEIPMFQLRAYHLPQQFEDAISETLSAQQNIITTEQLQKSKVVQFNTRVMQAEKKLEAKVTQAAGEASAIEKQNEAFNTQYKLTQDLLVEALVGIQQTTSWSTQQLLEYLKLKAVRSHPAGKTTIRI